MNLEMPLSARQRTRERWSTGMLQERWHLALGAALECSTVLTYTSAVTSYISFCHLHELSTKPTIEKLCFYIVHTSHHIKPSSVKSYLSGICAELKPFYPDIRSIRSSPLVTRTLAGCAKLLGSPVNRKRALTEGDLRTIIRASPHQPRHDDLLFLAIVLVGWHCLMRLGELVDNDTVSLRDFRKTIARLSVKFHPDPRPHCSFFLPMHKADRLFEGSTVVFEKRSSDLDPLRFFNLYLQSRDPLFPHLPQLWLRASGTVPTRSWFMARIRSIFPSNDVAGHSLRAGGATALALAGTPLHQIQSIGRWSSDTFLIYLRKNPILIQGFLAGGSAFDAQQRNH